jgi:rhamnosyltransferase
MNVATVIVTYNPNINLFKHVIDRACKETDKVVIVDNNSANKKQIMELCKKYNDKCYFLSMPFNLGVPYALEIGSKYILKKFEPEWILFLDQDSILLRNAIQKPFSIYNNLTDTFKKRIGIIALGWSLYRERKINFRIYETIYHSFSGTILRAELVNKITFRRNFFLDQADYDLYDNVRKLGYRILVINENLLLHFRGKLCNIPFITKILNTCLSFLTKHLKLKALGQLPLSEYLEYVDYEPPWRFYYIARNSTILLLEGKKDIIAYLTSLIYRLLTIIYVNGILLAMKSLLLGLFHGLMKYEGVIDKKYFEK